MRLSDFLTEEQLDEVNYKKAIGAGALAALTAAGSYNAFRSNIHDFFNQNKPTQSTPTTQPTPKPAPVKDEAKELADRILSKYKNVDPELALKIAKLAKKYEKPVFPKADDILSVVGIESSFNPNAVSQLKKDPAVGLTQIRPGVHKLDPKRLRTDIEHQIQKSSEILDQYNRGLKDPDAAIIAYNAGYGDYRKGNYNQNYINKFNKEKQLYR
jgi:Transglycosylase SLT domain